jgi:YYY domain-containing protein
MSETIRWWLILQVIGIALLPLCLALFRRLPDRGYALSKPFGLIMLGYVFWLLNSLHVLPNSGRGILGALVLLAIVSGWFFWRERDATIEWARAHWQYILGVEVLFLFVFAMAVYLRSLVGDISGTEQPMDLMFLNAATNADHFPPKDPWLAGHDVAYYYFGYLLVAIVGKLAGVPTEIGYNIGLAMVATMALVGAAGLVYNLVAMRESAVEREAAPARPQAARARVREQEKRTRRQRAVAPGEHGAIVVPEGGASDSGASAAFNWRPPVFGILGGLMFIVMGNLAWVFEFASAYGIGGSGFYDWVDIEGLAANSPRHSWYPSKFFAFFDASRIYPLDSQTRVITEFPMFSFLLGDLHPHVMALPFVVVVAGLALTLFRSREPLDITFWLQRPLALIAAAMLLGGLLFINTWDVVAMSSVVVGAAFVSNFGRVRAITVDLFVQIVSFALPLLVLAAVLYSPFLVSIAGNSQADGLFSVVANSAVTDPGTRPLHLLIFWGPLFAAVIPFVVARILPLRRRMTPVAAALAITPFLAVVAGWTLLFLYQAVTDDKHLGSSYGSLFSQVGDRGSGWLSAIFVGVVLAATIVALWIEATEDDDRAERQGVLFTLVLATIALLLILGTEFFYVGDIFNNRMNTVFKLYYEAWFLLAVAGAFSFYYLVSGWRLTFPRAPTYRIAWGALAAVVLAGAALYPLGGAFNRTHNTSGDLNGLVNIGSDDYQAIQWLQDQADGQDFVIAEAWGDDYSEAARVSAATGLPTILGWIGHENQWRSRNCKPCAGRIDDVKTLFTAKDLAQVQQIINKYDVQYVYVGNFARTRYQKDGGIGAVQQLPVAKQVGSVTIYRASGVTGEVSGQ